MATRSIPWRWVCSSLCCHVLFFFFLFLFFFCYCRFFSCFWFPCSCTKVELCNIQLFFLSSSSSVAIYREDLFCFTTWFWNFYVAVSSFIFVFIFIFRDGFFWFWFKFLIHLLQKETPEERPTVSAHPGKSPHTLFWIESISGKVAAAIAVWFLCCEIFLYHIFFFSTPYKVLRRRLLKDSPLNFKPSSLNPNCGWFVLQPGFLLMTSSQSTA